MDVEVSEEFREQCYSGESLYNARLTINGNEVPTSQIKKITINSPIVDKSQEGFYIGTFISQEITIIFKNLDGLDIQTGNEVYLEIGQLINGEYEYVPIGHYLIDDLSENYSSTCQIPCLDYATKFKPNVDYSPCFVDGSATVDTILEWICEYFDVEIGDYPNINGDVEVSTYDSTVSGKQWISYIAELKGCNAKMGRDGRLYLIPIKREPTTTIDALKSKSWSLGEKYEISKVVYFDAIRNFTFGDDTENTLYIRQDNPFVTGTYAEQVVENIFDEVNGFQVYSLKVENYGDVSLNCWDIVTYTLGEDENQNTISYNTFYDNNMIYEMNIMVTNETKIATKQQEVTTNVLGGDEKAKIRKLSTTVNGLEGTITLLAEEVGEYDDRITTVEQDVNTIRQTAISYEDLKRNVKSVNMLHLENAVPNYPLKFSIKNASVLFPKTNLYPSSNTIPEYRHLVLVVDKTRNLSDEAKIIELPVKNLYAKDDVYDEFVVEKNRAKLIHRLILNQGELQPSQQEFVEDLGEVDIQLFEGDNYIYLYSLINDGAIYEIDYIIPSEFTDTFATEVYVNSSIEQTANQILLQVNEKVDEDEIIAKLNVAVEDGQGIVELKGNAVTIDSDNFNLDADGTINAVNGNFSGTITSSNINNNGVFMVNETGTVTITDPDGTLSGKQNLILESPNKKNSINSGYVSIRDKNNTDLWGSMNVQGVSFQGGTRVWANLWCDKAVSGGHGGGLEIANGTSSAWFYPDWLYCSKIESNNFVNTSTASNKKNFEKLTNAKEILKNTDIYKYNFKEESEDTKKHIGFVIGDKFNYSQDITSAENNGADVYAMTSVLWQVVKEQQEEIDELKKLIKEGDK